MRIVAPPVGAGRDAPSRGERAAGRQAVVHGRAAQERELREHEALPRPGVHARGLVAERGRALAADAALVERENLGPSEGAGIHGRLVDGAAEVVCPVRTRTVTKVKIPRGLRREHAERLLGHLRAVGEDPAHARGLVVGGRNVRPGVGRNDACGAGEVMVRAAHVHPVGPEGAIAGIEPNVRTGLAAGVPFGNRLETHGIRWANPRFESDPRRNRQVRRGGRGDREEAAGAIQGERAADLAVAEGSSRGGRQHQSTARALAAVAVARPRGNEVGEWCHAGRGHAHLGGGCGGTLAVAGRELHDIDARGREGSRGLESGA